MSCAVPSDSLVLMPALPDLECLLALLLSKVSKAIFGFYKPSPP